MVLDKIVYAIANYLQWRYPDKCKRMLIILGLLHVEIAFMDLIVRLCKRNSLSKIMSLM